MEVERTKTELSQSIYDGLYDIKLLLRNVEDIVNVMPEFNINDPRLAPVNHLKRQMSYYDDTLEFLVEAVEEISKPTLKERILQAAA